MTTTSLRHQALLHGGTSEFLEAAVPFLREGLETDDHVLAVVPEHRLEVLRATLGPDGSGITYVDAAVFYRHPVRTIAAYHDVVAQAAPRRVRALAELDWSRFPEPWEQREWGRYESLVNALFERSGAQVICSYDRTTAPPPVVEDVRRTHQELFEHGPYPVYNDDYTSPERYSADRDRLPLSEVPADADRLPLSSLDDLSEMRAFLSERALRRGLPEDKVGPLCLAANEIATNAVVHGTPPIELRVWHQGGRVYCEVADVGLWHPDVLTGYLPPESAVSGGFGLWSARMLVDLLEIRAGYHGTRVRLQMAC
jgi:anti-sigma regulatory factor (Ser/Thr protein kinase)